MGLSLGGGQAGTSRGCVTGQRVADTEALLLVGLEHVGEAEALAADVAWVWLLASVRAPVAFHVGPAGEALAADLTDVGLLPWLVAQWAVSCWGAARTQALGASPARARGRRGVTRPPGALQPCPCPVPTNPAGSPHCAPVWVFMCSSKYCFMLKSLPHHWHMNCLCPMWMLMWERSWYLYWNRSSQFCTGHTGKFLNAKHRSFT